MGKAICLGGGMDNKQYLRFTLNERIQHMIIFLTFVLLFLTGFSLKYGTTETAGFLIRLMGGKPPQRVVDRGLRGGNVVHDRRRH